MIDYGKSSQLEGRPSDLYPALASPLDGQRTVKPPTKRDKNRKLERKKKWPKIMCLC